MNVEDRVAEVVVTLSTVGGHGLVRFYDGRPSLVLDGEEVRRVLDCRSMADTRLVVDAIVHEREQETAG